MDSNTGPYTPDILTDGGAEPLPHLARTSVDRSSPISLSVASSVSTTMEEELRREEFMNAPELMEYQESSMPLHMSQGEGAWIGDEVGIQDVMEMEGVRGEMQMGHQVQRVDDGDMEWMMGASGGAAPVAPSMFAPSGSGDHDKPYTAVGASPAEMGGGEWSSGFGSVVGRRGGGWGGVYRDTFPQQSDHTLYADQGVVPQDIMGGIFTRGGPLTETGGGAEKGNVLGTSSSGVSMAGNFQGAHTPTTVQALAPSTAAKRHFPFLMSNYSSMTLQSASDRSSSTAALRPPLPSNTSAETVFTARPTLSSTPSAGSTSTSVNPSPIVSTAQKLSTKIPLSRPGSDSSSGSAITTGGILGSRKYSANVPGVSGGMLGMVGAGRGVGARDSGRFGYGAGSTEAVRTMGPGPSETVVAVAGEGQAVGMEQRAASIEEQALEEEGPFVSRHESVLGRVQAVPSPASVSAGGSFQGLFEVKGPRATFPGEGGEEQVDEVASSASGSTGTLMRGLSDLADSPSDSSTPPAGVAEARKPRAAPTCSSPGRPGRPAGRRGLVAPTPPTSYSALLFGDDGVIAPLNQSTTDILPAKVSTVPGSNPLAEGGSPMVQDQTVTPTHYLQTWMGAFDTPDIAYGSALGQPGSGQGPIPVPTGNIMAQVGHIQGRQSGSGGGSMLGERAHFAGYWAENGTRDVGVFPAQEPPSSDRPFIGQESILLGQPTPPTQNLSAQSGIVVTPIATSCSGPSMVQYTPAIPPTRSAPQVGSIPAPGSAIGYNQLWVNPFLANPSSPVAPMRVVPSQEPAMHRPFVGQVEIVPNAATAHPGNVMDQELVAPAPRYGSNVPFISAGEGVMEEVCQDAVPGPYSRGRPFLRQMDPMNTSGTGLSIRDSAPAIHTGYALDAVEAPLSGHRSEYMGGQRPAPSIAPAPNSGTFVESVGAVQSTDGPHYAHNDIRALVSTRDGDMCWACEDSSGLDLLSLLPVDDVQKFDYYRSLNLFPFSSPHHADNLILLCPSCRMNMHGASAGLIILPSDLNFFALFEEADFLRRARTGEARSVPTAAEYAPRKYTVYRVQNGTAYPQHGFVERKAWGGTPTTLIIKANESIRMAGTAVPQGILMALEMLMWLYARSEKPRIVDVKREIEVATEMLRMRSIVGFGPVSTSAVGIREAVANPVMDSDNGNMSINNTPSPTQHRINTILSVPDNDPIPADYPISPTDGPLPDAAEPTMSIATANLLDRYHRVARHLAAREIAFAPEESGRAKPPLPDHNNALLPVDISSFASFLGASLVAEGVARHGLQGAQAVGESARWALQAADEAVAAESAGGPGRTPEEEPRMLVPGPAGEPYLDDVGEWSGDEEMRMDGMEWEEGVEAEVQDERDRATDGEPEAKFGDDLGNINKDTQGRARRQDGSLELDLGQIVKKVDNSLVSPGGVRSGCVLTGAEGCSEGAEAMSFMTDGAEKGTVPREAVENVDSAGAWSEPESDGTLGFDRETGYWGPDESSSEGGQEQPEMAGGAQNMSRKRKEWEWGDV